MTGAGRGRKPKTDDRRDKVIRCRVTESFRDQVVGASRKSGVSISSYIQSALANEMRFKHKEDTDE